MHIFITRRHAVAALFLSLTLILSGCVSAPGSSEMPESITSSTTAAAPHDPAEPSEPSEFSEDPWDGEVTAKVEVVAEHLPEPWGMAPLPGGRFLVTLRDSASLVVVHPSGVIEPIKPSRDVRQLARQTVSEGEGGLLGVAVDPDNAGPMFTVFLYRTGTYDNAVLRAELDLDSMVLRDLTTILDGIPRASRHNGGRVKLGPDGYLYVTTGDAEDATTAQNKESWGGKILRITPTGDPAPGNPDPHSPVWSMGHRNVQGVGWDMSGRMFASEFGQNRLDELNVIEPGGDYGWPIVEGSAADVGEPEEFVDPVVWWPTSQASPSGIAVTEEAVYLASLRGECLWRVPLLGSRADVAAGKSPGFGEPQALLSGRYGRLRAVHAGEDGELFVLTNNTDGRGRPLMQNGQPVDDRLLRIQLSSRESRTDIQE